MRRLFGESPQQKGEKGGTDNRPEKKFVVQKILKITLEQIKYSVDGIFLFHGYDLHDLTGDSLLGRPPIFFISSTWDEWYPVPSS